MEQSHVALCQETVGDAKSSEAGIDAAAQAGALIARLLRCAPILFSIKDEHGRWVFLSSAMQRAIGRSDWLGRTADELLPPGVARQVAENDRAVLRAGHAMQFVQETPVGCGGFGRRLVTKWPLSDEAGRRYVVTLAVDVDELAVAHESLSALARFAGTVLDAISSHVAVIDSAGAIVAVNDAWMRFSQANGGRPDRTGVGSNYLAVCDAAAAEGDRLAGEFAAGIRAVMEGRTELFELEYPCHSPQQQRWFAGRATRAASEGPVRVVVVHENITARKLAEMETAARAQAEGERDRLRGAVEAMKQVLGVVGHELRTPLAGLLSIAELLNMPELRDMSQRERYIEVLPREIRRMSDIVNNLLEAARLDAGAARWNWGDVEYLRVCKEAVETMEPLAEERKVRLEWSVEPAELHGAGDAEAVGRLIVNLLSNACYHTPQGGTVTLTCRLAADAGGDAVEVTVADTGEGISPERAGTLGEPFACSSGMTGRNRARGSGLGLAICRGIVGAHGGCITIESTPRLGTTVRAVLRRDLEAPLAEVAVIEFAQRAA